MLLPPLLLGCSSGGGVQGLFDVPPGARFSGSSENGFLARVVHFCADTTVGNQRLGGLLEQDAQVRALTLELYRGEVSNDEYVTRLLSLHPAANGNVPAAGCVIEQFNACTSGQCSQPATTADKPETEQEATPKLKAEL
jgi:hypothetical protein